MAVIPKDNPLSVRKDRYYGEPFNFFDDNGDPYNFSGATIDCTVRETLKQSDPEVCNVTISWVNAALGQALLEFFPVDTNDLTTDIGYYDIVIDPNGIMPESYAYGKITFSDMPTEVTP